MNEKALNTLEFHKIRERLAGFTSFSASRELALSLLPSAELQEVQRRQQATREAKRLLDLKSNFSLGGVYDVRPAAQRAMMGGILQTDELLNIQSTLAAGRTVRATIVRLNEQLPLLSEVAQHIADSSRLEAEIARCIDQRGEVLDSASPALGRIRHEAKVAHDRLLTRMNELLSSAQSRQVAQEPIITLRGGRYVIPVKAEFKGEVRGIVHDVSSSGATVFVEPLAAIDLGNTWRELQIEEEREVERILRRLSTEVWAQAEAIQTNVESLAEIDLALAKAKYGLSTGANEPELRSDGSKRLLKVVDARHPLLSGDVVPISLEIGKDYSIVLITGPNTGGKTVALKTVGLLVLMAQAGLAIPAAEGSQLPVYDAVFADIGDEQSIEQSLSTFSSHMGNIIEIINRATGHSLILLDELGAGTDPAEGSALARAILSHLLQWGITTIATTHHSELKVFAHNTPGIQNASVEFDPETLAPTYRLSLGLPGRSNAIAIAARLGLYSEIIEEARSMISPGQMEADSLLADIQRERDKAMTERRSAEERRAKLEHEEGLLSQRLSNIEEEKREIIDTTRSEMEAEAEELRKRLRRVAASIEDKEQLADELRAIRAELDRGPWRPKVQPTPSVESGAPTLQPGDVVWIRGLNQRGVILSPPDSEGEVEVQVGALKAKVRLDQVEVREGMGAGERAATISLPALRREALPGLELHLRGKRVDEILPELDRYLNDAFLAGLPQVRIVHGKGTGTLRQVVREQLAAHPLVKSFRTAERNQGGEGVTVAELAQ